MSDYDEVVVEESDIESIRGHIDEITDRVRSESDEESDDEVTEPERVEVAHEKWMKQAEMTKDQQGSFGKNRVFYGHHVVNGNILRSDNTHHMMNLEVANMYDQHALFRSRANIIRQADIQEHMLCRAGPERGGFDRKMDRSVLKREDVDVRQSQSLSDMRKPLKKKSGMLGFLRKKNKE